MGLWPAKTHSWLIGAGFLALVLVGVIFYFKTPKVETILEPSGQTLAEKFGLSQKEPDTKLFYSDALGVGFTYDTDPGSNGSETIAVTEREKKIFVHDVRQNPEDGQYVEVFTKDLSITLEQAIEEQFLVGYNPADCFVVTYPNADRFLSAGISFPKTGDPEGPWWQNSFKCPQPYSEANEVKSFLMDPVVPGKFLFLRSGQAVMTFDGTTEANGGPHNWSQSIRILE